MECQSGEPAAAMLSVKRSAILNTLNSMLSCVGQEAQSGDVNGGAVSVDVSDGASTPSEIPFEERAVDRDMEIKRLKAIIKCARSGCKDADHHSLVQSALSNYRAVLYRLTIGFISDHIFLQNKRKCVGCVQLHDD